MDVYQIVTEKIVSMLEKGTIPWRKTWAAGSGMPRNLVTKKEYRGLNVFLLGCQPFSSPYWLTFKQAKERGGFVKQGEKSSLVVFWKMLDKKPDVDGEVSGKIPMLRYYNLFNVEQCEGLAAPPDPEETVNQFTSIERAEKIIAGYRNKPIISYGGNRAFYRPAEDLVQMPHEHTFERSENFYSVLMHELAHSTGAAHRLARKEVIELNAFGSHDYSSEELTAEFCASFLCAHAGISSETIEMSAAYIDGWLSVLKGDKKLLVIAAARAQAAADYILGRTFNEEEQA